MGLLTRKRRVGGGQHSCRGRRDGGSAQFFMNLDQVNFTLARRKGIMCTIRISGAWPCIHDRAAAAAAAAEVEVHRLKNQIVCVCVRVLACLRACARLHPTVGYCRCLIISDSISDAAWMARMVVSACTTNHAPLSLDSACLSMLSAA